MSVHAGESNPVVGEERIDEATFRDVLGHFATGVTVVTAMEDDTPVGFTCQAFTALSLDPPMVALAPAKTSTSWPKIARAGSFCVNILAHNQADLCSAFAVSGGDKFVDLAWHLGRTGSPVLEGTLAHVECLVHLIHDAGDHELVIGQVAALGLGRGRPLIFYRGELGALPE